MKSKLLGLLAVVGILSLSPSPGHALTFDFSFTGGCNVAGSPCTVTGEIDGLTNGTNVAATAVIIDTVSSPAFTLPSPLPFNTFCGSNCLVTSNSFTVTAGVITAYDFDVTGTTTLWSLSLGVLAANEDTFSNGTGGSQINVLSQGTTFTPVGTPTTPLPAALPLFASGIGAMGFFGWRKKRKNTAAIAAA
jgi:hypothetical protein